MEIKRTGFNCVRIGYTDELMMSIQMIWTEIQANPHLAGGTMFHVAMKVIEELARMQIAVILTSYGTKKGTLNREILDEKM